MGQGTDGRTENRVDREMGSMYLCMYVVLEAQTAKDKVQGREGQTERYPQSNVRSVFSRWKNKKKKEVKEEVLAIAQVFAVERRLEIFLVCLF